jgi:hypothetical protein
MREAAISDPLRWSGWAVSTAAEHTYRHRYREGIDATYGPFAWAMAQHE